MASFDDNPEDSLTNEAEELMRQGRFKDAVGRYEELCTRSPSDVMARLAYASALECAGQLSDAERVVSETASAHRGNSNVHRFQHLFFERREDYNRANLCQELLRDHNGLNDGPVDQLADLYFNQGRYHEALKELERIQHNETFDDDSMFASVLGRIGACHRQAQKHQTALDFLERAMEYDHENHWLITELAEAHRALGNRNQARDAYNDALQMMPSDHFARSRLAHLEYEEGKQENAVGLYEDILADQPKAHWAMVELAQMLSMTDRERSRDLCHEALDIDPTFPAAYSQLGQLARLDNDLETARAHYNEALDNMPNANWILHELADISHQLGHNGEAQVYLDRARSNDPFDSITYGVQADLLRNEQKLDQAIPYLQKAVELDDEYAWAWRELTEVYALLGRHDEADETYKRYCELEQNQAYSDGLRAFLLRHRDQHNASVPFLERAVQEQADYFWAWRELVEHYLQNENYSLAEEKAKAAIEHVGNHPALWAMLAESHRQQQAYPEAIHAVEQAMALDQDIPQLWALRAELLIHSDSEEAITCAKRATELDNAVEYAILYAQCLLHGRRLADAKALVHGLIERKQTDSFLFDMAAEIAQRDSDIETAITWTEEGLLHHSDDRRLLLRRALLAVEQNDKRALELLNAAAEAPQQKSWHEFVLAYAQAGDINRARRYAYTAIERHTGPEDDKARIWLSLAEAELTAKNIEEAKQALHECLRCDEMYRPAHLLLGMLAEQAQDYDDAAFHLQTVYEQYAEQHAQDDVDMRSLLRQLAHIEEQRHHIDSARDYLKLLSEHSNNDLNSIIDQAAFDLRHEHQDDAEEQLLHILHVETHDEHAKQRAIHNLAWHYLHRDSAASAHRWLLQHLDILDAQGLALAAQLALAHGEFTFAVQHIDAIPESSLSAQHRRLRCRAYIGLGSFEAAEQELRALYKLDESSEESANLLGECLAYQGKHSEALEILRNPALGLVANDERLFLVACILLEHSGSEHCLNWLGHKPPHLVDNIPLKRVFQEAYKDIWCDRDCDLASENDLLALPPFPRAIQRLATAFIEREQFTLASQSLMLAHNVAQDQGLVSLRREIAANCARFFKPLKQHALARRFAWDSKNPLLILRCLLWF